MTAKLDSRPAIADTAQLGVIEQDRARLSVAKTDACCGARTCKRKFARTSRCCTQSKIAIRVNLDVICTKGLRLGELNNARAGDESHIIRPCATVHDNTLRLTA